MQVDSVNVWVFICSAVCRSGWKLDADSIATFSVDSKSGRELRPYLTSVTEKCEQQTADLPKVIIIDGLHHISSPLSDAFDGFLTVDYKSRWFSTTDNISYIFFGYMQHLVGDILWSTFTVCQIVTFFWILTFTLVQGISGCQGKFHIWEFRWYPGGIYSFA